MGAAVKDDGQPSGALERRIQSALEIAENRSDVYFIATGGVGKNKSSEAEVMKRILLHHEVLPEKIIVDDQSRDTLDSIINCSQILKKHSPRFQSIIISSDLYHLPRCRWLFYLKGIKTTRVKVLSGLSANGLAKWAYYYFRELAAIIYDTFLIIPYLFQK